jgi:hypothetical protein
MAEEKKERWLQWIALTTTILAVSAAISSLKGSSFSTKVQLSTVEETNRWSYFQSKSIKQHATEMQRDNWQLQLKEITNPEIKAFIENNLKNYEADIARYDKEKKEIQTDAENFAFQEKEYKRHNADFSLAVMLLQIAIMLSSVGALLKKQPMWYMGMIVGAGGLVYMMLGFFG